MTYFFSWRLLITLALTSCSMAAHAQLGIGTTAPSQRAALEIAASDKGVLIPRLDSAQRAQISAPPQGLLVYQKDGRQGLWYFHSGTGWQYIQPKGDNLGNHTATTDLKLGANQLVNAVGNPGLSLDNAGKATAAGFKATGLAGTGSRLPVVLPDGTLGVNAPVYGTTAPMSSVPVLRGSVATGTSPWSVAVSGPTAYVVNYNSNTLQVFDVATPSAPVLLGSVATGSKPYSVVVSGPTAYVVNYNSSTLQVFNVATPSAPALLGSVATGSGPVSVAVSGPTAYVLSHTTNTLQVFNVATPSAPVLLGSVATGTGPAGVAVSGATAYVSNYDSNTLQVFNVATPSAPVLLGSVATGSGPYSVAVSGPTAYVVNYISNTLQVFDVATPSAPALLGSVATGTNPHGVAVSGPTAYVVNYTSNTLQVFDVATPSAPVLFASVATGTNPQSVAVSGPTAYVVNLVSNTLQVFSPPEPPRTVAVNPDGSFASVVMPSATDFVQNRTTQQPASNFSISGTGAVGGSMGIGTQTANAAAALDVSSTTKGALLPRMTTAQRDVLTTAQSLNTTHAGLTLYNTSTNKLNVWNGTSWEASLSATELAVPVSVNQAFGTGTHTYTVPAGIYSLSIDAKGAKGGSASPASGTPGNGGRVQATLAVTPGEVLNLSVGGVGITAASAGSGGGFNGGGAAGTSNNGGGGGATDIRRGGTALANRILVAAGGGGATATLAGGGGGSPVGTSGGGGGAFRGSGGTLVSGGGSAGTGPLVVNGAFGTGGTGDYTGGGGGYYGGGGGGRTSGSNPGGGGGGSSWVTPTGSSAIAFFNSTNAGAGTLTITGTGATYAAPVLDASNFVNLPITASNGLTKTGTDIALGGTLTQATTLTGGAFALSVTTTSLDASNGVEFRHTNGTQGLGFGFNSIYAAGSNADQNLNLMPKGTGNVGIGTVSPTARLAVLGSGAATVDFTVNGRLRTGDASNSGGVWLNSGLSQFVGQYDATTLGLFNAGWRLTVTNGGNVGIGTTAPTVRLDVPTGNVRLPGGGGSSDSWFNYTGDGKNYLRGTTVLADNGGNVGIGTTNPSQKLDVTGNTNVTGNSYVGGTVGIGTTAPRGVFDVASSGDTYLAADPIAGTSQSLFLPGHLYLAPFNGSDISYLQARRADNSGTSALRVRTVNNGIITDAMHIAGNGFVGIGTTNPTAPLTITGSGDHQLVLNNNGGDPNGVLQIQILNTAPVGGSELVYFVRGGNGVIGSINANNNSVSYNTTSDKRLKENFGRTRFGLRDLMKLEVKDYNFIGQPATARTTGFLAQDLFKVYPDAVKEGDHGSTVTTTWGVDYGKLTPLLVQAIQDQQAEIEALKTANAALQAANAAQGHQLGTQATSAATDHAALLMLQAQMARLLGEAPPATQARKR